MPDLSNLLGAVYGDTPSSESPRGPEDEAHVEHEPAAGERGPAVPDWADDEHLDAAFAQWKPGPPEDASPTEHAVVKGADDDPPPPLADDLAAALSEALVASSGAADDTDDDGFKPTKVVDFSDADDEDAPETEKTEAPTALAPTVEDEDDVEHHEDVVAHHEDDTSEDAHDEADHLRHLPAITPQREAAAELTATSRFEPGRVVTPPAPEPEPTGPATVPTPAAPATSTPAADAVEVTTPVVAVPVGARQWDRSNDDILPDKQTKKFFSLSLRRG
ncbi:MAG: hypothetical protein E6G57_04995 [Actinobacteria bacterium]|nr:MAG: hypothetical protein E6G57_04995 [Actinomycetota bacterium]